MAGNKPGKIVAIAVSRKKGTRKTIVEHARVIEHHGIENDAHAGDWHRQISFLSSESIQLAKSKGLDVNYGDFAENFATSGVEWTAVPVGTKIMIGSAVIVEITQIGKECHNRCAIYYQAGDCIMPKEGTFARVLKGGTVTTGDSITFI